MGLFYDWSADDSQFTGFEKVVTEMAKQYKNRDYARADFAVTVKGTEPTLKVIPKPLSKPQYYLGQVLTLGNEHEKILEVEVWANGERIGEPFVPTILGTPTHDAVHGLRAQVGEQLKEEGMLTKSDFKRQNQNARRWWL